MNLEKLDRRLFLQGLTLSSAGLIIPKPIISVPAIQYDEVPWGPLASVADSLAYARMVERVGGTIQWKWDGSSIARYPKGNEHIALPI